MTKAAETTEPTGKKVIRTDSCQSPLTRHKEELLHELVLCWRADAVSISGNLWRRFCETGPLPARLDTPELHLLPANMAQMCSAQVKGMLESWVSNRANEFKQAVMRHNAFKDEERRVLLHINKQRHWHLRGEVLIPKLLDKDEKKAHAAMVKAARGKGEKTPPYPKEPAPAHLQLLARQMFRNTCKNHRLPNCSRVHPMLDQRVVSIERPVNQKSHFGLWAKISTLVPGRRIYAPVGNHELLYSRKGTVIQALQLICRKDGISLGIMTDIAKGIDQSAYVPECEQVALDGGLCSLLSSNFGDLYGRRFFGHVSKLDRKLATYAAERQRHSLPVATVKQKALVRQLRGYVETEINRIVNRIVETRKPGKIIVERLDFRNQTLSRRMNRLILRMGRSALREKLDDINKRFGIEIVEMNAAYSSQECHSCGYVDDKNRKRQDAFSCRFCKTTLHADVNAPRTLIRRGRSSVEVYRQLWQHRKCVLAAVVKDFNERFPRARDGATDPRFFNPYFKDWAAGVGKTQKAEPVTVQLDAVNS